MDGGKVRAAAKAGPPVDVRLRDFDAPEMTAAAEAEARRDRLGRWKRILGEERMSGSTGRNGPLEVIAAVLAIVMAFVAIMDNPAWQANAFYDAVKDFQTLIGAVLGFGGLAGAFLPPGLPPRRPHRCRRSNPPTGLGHAQLIFVDFVICS